MIQLQAPAILPMVSIRLETGWTTAGLDLLTRREIHVTSENRTLAV